MRSASEKMAAFTIGTVLAAGLLSAAGHDWPNWSGPMGNRTSVGNGAFDDSAFGLKRDWVRALGSGYSGVAVVDDLAVTGFSDGESDFLLAMDTTNGEEKWRYRIAEVYEGHDGSDDGPIATPTVHDGTVYGLGAWGHLFAVRLADGRQIWSHRMDSAFGAVKPEYGFSSSPAVVDEVLIVLTGGGEGRSISGFDRSSGKLVWSSQDDPIGYQSPLGATIGGRSQVLAVTNQHLYGLDPRSGQALWRHKYKENEEPGFAQPVLVGEDSVLLNDWEEAAVFRITRSEETYAVDEVWRNNAFRSTYALPVYWQGHLYGYSGSILKCVNAATGETVWRSRPPGQGTLILVDGHLVIQARSGHLVVAEASPEGYVEKSRVAALDRGHLTSPSFAGGRIFTRSSTQIAGLSITDAAMAAARAPEARSELLGDFGEWVKRVRGAETKNALIEQLLSSHESFPILEGDRLVHFVFRGDVPDLALTGNLLQGADLPMERIEGTDFYYRSLSLEPASVFTYGFNVFDDFRTDPLNPRAVGPEGSRQSVVATPGWAEPAHVAEPKGAKGTIKEYTWKSEILENERTVQIYLPAGYGDSTRRYPLLVVNHGDQALSFGQMNNTLDNLIGVRIEPVIAAFVPRLRWPEYGGSRPDDYSRALVEELLPYIDKTYRTQTDPQTRGIMGVGSAGFVSVYATFTQPGAFGKAASQSFYLGDRGDELLEAIQQAEPDGRSVYVEWSRMDYHNEESGLDARQDSSRLAELLKKRGFRTVTNEVGHGPGWLSWRAGHARILETMYPKK